MHRNRTICLSVTQLTGAFQQTTRQAATAAASVCARRPLCSAAAALAARAPLRLPFQRRNFSRHVPPPPDTKPHSYQEQAERMNNPYALLQNVAPTAGLLHHSVDRYSGITVPDTSLLEIATLAEFEQVLAASMAAWTAQKRRGLWMQVPIEKSDFIAAAAKHGFEFHHAQPRYAYSDARCGLPHANRMGYVMMTLWLPSKALTGAQMSGERAPADGILGCPKPGTAAAAAELATTAASCSSCSDAAAPAAASSSTGPVPEPSMIPAYASHSLGIGCLVLNSRGEALVIQERFAHPLLPAFWKLPGGAVDQGEELDAAAEREVLEETGVKATFRTVLGFRHLLNFRFGTGDLYFIAVCTVDESAGIPDPTPQPEEIGAAKWWNIEEFLNYHSTRWFQDLVRAPALAEWARLYPGRTLPPSPSPERIRELQTYPPHPDAASGKSYPIVATALPPPSGPLGLQLTKTKSALGRLESKFYVVAPPITAAATAAAQEASSSSSNSAASSTAAAGGASKL